MVQLCMHSFSATNSAASTATIDFRHAGLLEGCGVVSLTINDGHGKRSNCLTNLHIQPTKDILPLRHASHLISQTGRVLNACAIRKTLAESAPGGIIMFWVYESSRAALPGSWLLRCFNMTGCRLANERFIHLSL